MCGVPDCDLQSRNSIISKHAQIHARAHQVRGGSILNEVPVAAAYNRLDGPIYLRSLPAQTT